MRRILTIISAMLLLASSAQAREFAVSGPQGGLSMKVSLPKGFDTAKDSCHMVILMHGIFSSKDYPPMPNIAKALAKEGIASIRFDFDGHGRSEGQMIGMTAGDVDTNPEALVLLAPGAVIKEATQGGHFFGNSFDPKDPPEYIKCFHHFKLGRNYLLQTQDLDIYGVSEKYQGPVCIIHGSEDGIVPLWCSEKYDAIYGSSEMHIVEGENHLIIKKRKEVIGIILDFLSNILK